MRNTLKILARISFRLLPLIIFCTLPLAANAQNPLRTNTQISRPEGIPEGYSVIDGDILMPTEYVQSLLKGQKLSPDAPQATYRTNVWTSGTAPFGTRGIVAFEFDANVTPANQSAMLSAMAVLESVANVHFQQCSSNVCIFSVNNFVHISNANANNSQVGMIGGEQFINITSWNSQFIIAHELLHCLGFFHEQSRPDRNTFVQINCANVQGGCNGTLFNSNFLIESALTFGNYDFDSLMHYGECAFTVGGNCPADGTQTIIVLAPNQNQQTLIGQRTHLSSLDRATVSFLYPFDNWTLLDCTYNGSNGTSDGSFNRPYTTLAAALADTPAGGTIWVLKNCTLPIGIYNNQVTIRAAPGVTATFGN